MIQKYSTLSLKQNENETKTLDETIAFLLSYSKAIEVKKLKKRNVILCKN
jgi:hypothetical protein